MSVTSERTAIRPFTVDFPEADVADLRKRIAATRWPEKETVDDQSQGPQLATIQEIVRYWGEDYDFGRVKAKVDAYPNFVTEIDGLDIHFIHVRSKHEDASADHRHARVARIGRRTAEAHRAADRPDSTRWQCVGRLPRGDPVDAGLRLLRQADRHGLGARPYRARLGRADEAPRLHPVRRAGWRLGRSRHRPHGCAGT